MKIFSNKLYFFFFSLLFCLCFFIGNVNAADNQVNAVYNSNTLSKIENYSVLIDNIRETINNNLETINNYDTRINLLNDENIVVYNMFDTSSKQVYVDFVYNARLHFSDATYIGIYTEKLQVWFNYDENYNITSFRSNGRISSYNYFNNLNFYDYSYGKNSTLMLNNNRYSTDIFVGPNATPFLTGTSMSLYDFVQALDADLIPNPNPTIQPPYNIYHNGYTETIFLINNYTLESNQNGYFIRIVNNNNGNIQNINPDVSNADQEITLTSYENTNYTIQIYDREYNIIQEYSINANINYADTNFNVEITNVDNNTKEVFYKYIISDNTQDYTCYHSINNNEYIQDLDCTDTSTVYYNLTMPNNGNLAFKIEDSNSNIVYQYNQNFVFSVSDTYISFQDNFDNNYLNLNVLINRYQTNDIVEYSINNSSFIQANLLDYSTTQNIKNFYVNNLNNNDILIVRVKRNNEIITYATYKANYLKNNTSSDNNFNLNNFFDKLNINNINSNLRNYITQIGNIFINSKLGNLIILEFFIMVVCWVLKTIRK